MNVSLFRRSGVFALLILVFYSAAVSFAQDVTRTGISIQPANVSEFEVNGLKVIVKRRPNAPTVAAGLFIRGGSRNITAREAGIESLMLNVAMEASAKFPREVLRREVSRTGSSISAGANYDFSVAALGSTRANFDSTWKIFADVLMNPSFNPRDVELIKSRTVTALRNAGDDPDGLLNLLESKIVYSGHPYAIDPDGTIETVSSFTARQLADYHKKAMQTSRLLLIVVGDIEPPQIQSLVAESFGKLPRGEFKAENIKPLTFAEPTLDVTSRSLPTNYIQGVFAAPALNNPDYFAMRVAISILRDRIFEEVRLKRNLSYAPTADMELRAANTAGIYVTAVDANQAISVMLNEIEKLKTIAIDAREISGVTGQFLTNYFLGQETSAAQATELARYELLGEGWRNSFEFLNRVNAVTDEDIRRVSKKYITNIRFIVVGNPAAINRDIFLQK